MRPIGQEILHKRYFARGEVPFSSEDVGYAPLLQDAVNLCRLRLFNQLAFEHQTKPHSSCHL